MSANIFIDGVGYRVDPVVVNRIFEVCDERETWKMECYQRDAELAQLRHEHDEASAELREIAELIAPLEGQTLLEAVSYLIHDDGEPLTPRKCGPCCTEAARQMRDSASHAKTDMDTDNVLGWEHMTAVERRMWRAGYLCGTQDMHDSIIAMPLPVCADCNPLKPDVADAREALK